MMQVVRYRASDPDMRSTCVNVRLLSTDDHHGRVFYGTFFVFAFVLPMTVICVLYSCMVLRLLRGAARNRCVHAGGSAESTRARRRVTRLVVVVVVTFGACWLPIHLVFIVQYFNAVSITNTFIAVRLAANCLAYANSCLNPILYAFLSENFRSGLARLCWRGGLVRYGNTVVQLRGARRQTVSRAQLDDLERRRRPAEPLLMVLEERQHLTTGQAVRVEALQIPTYHSIRPTETSAVIETAL